MNKTGLNNEAAYAQNHSADGRSAKGGESWMEERSHDNVSANMRDSSSNQMGNKAAPSSNTSNLKLKENSAIIPERRRKYLANASEERGDLNGYQQNTSIDLEITDNTANMHRKNN